jgi:hypothetical protein
MNEQTFDALVRTMTSRVGRREAIKPFVGMGLALAVTGLGVNRVTGRLTGPTPAAAAVQEAALCNPPQDTFCAFQDDGRCAETFVAATSGKLSRVQFEVGKAANSSGDYLVRLLAVNANGAPTNKVLAKARIPDASVPVGNAVTVVAHFKKRKTVTLKAGKRYAVSIRRSGGGITVSAASGDQCVHGPVFTSDTQTAPFVEQPGFDLRFVVFVGF